MDLNLVAEAAVSALVAALGAAGGGAGAAAGAATGAATGAGAATRIMIDAAATSGTGFVVAGGNVLDRLGVRMGCSGSAPI